MQKVNNFELHTGIAQELVLAFSPFECTTVSTIDRKNPLQTAGVVRTVRDSSSYVLLETVPHLEHRRQRHFVLLM